MNTQTPTRSFIAIAVLIGLQTVSVQALNLSSPGFLPDNTFQFSINGTAGDNVAIEAAPTACGTWVNIGTQVLPAGGSFAFIDAAATGLSNRFYRASVNVTNHSANALGFTKVTIYPGFNLIANQLDNPPNTISSLINGVPDGTQVYAFNGVYSSSVYDTGSWEGNPNSSLKPGEGIFVRNTSGASFVIRFVGNVMQGPLINPIPAGFSIRSELVPCIGPATLSCNEGEMIFTYVRTPSPGYASYVCDTGSWQPFTPTLNIGQAFFYFSWSNKSWVRNFSVWQ
jgi:hypothetical protein